MIRYNIFIYSLHQYTHSKSKSTNLHIPYTYCIQPKYFIAGIVIIIFFSELIFDIKKIRVINPFECSLNIMSLFGTDVVGNF